MNEARDISETLSGLERQVFLAVREAGQAQVHDIMARLGADGRELAYTTVMTVLVRLWEKGYLVRRKQGKAFLYMTRDHREIAGDLGAQAVREALEKYGPGALAGLVQSLTPEQRTILARLLGDTPATDSTDGGTDDA